VENGIEINEQFQRALDLLENTSKVLFITGRAGTGKSTLLRFFKEHSHKKSVVLAPTGVAALNVQGQTIHSFFGFDPEITVPEAQRIAHIISEKELYRRVEVIIIDEVSMVRADLLDCIDVFLRTIRGKNLPFGGAQLVFIGDLYQLPPVVKGEEEKILSFRYPTPFFFDALVMRELEEKLGNIEFVELEKIYRQEDEEFINILNAIRSRHITPEMLERLNSRFFPYPEELEEDHIVLTSTNQQANEINSYHLNRLKGKEKIYQGVLEGNFERRDLPTETELALKEKARVMFLVNDPCDRFVNGTLGTVVEIGKELVVVTDDGLEVELEPFTWEMYRSLWNPEEETIEREIVGTFTQIPLRLAWAITIHKSQGKTFPRVIIDLGKGAFASGQVYVALSRCTSLEGIILKKPIRLRDIRMDYRVVRYLTRLQAKLSEREMSFEEKLRILQQAISKGEGLVIIYLDGSGDKSRRKILPLSLEETEYMGKTFLGLSAFCYKRNSSRVFRVDRIIQIEKAD